MPKRKAAAVAEVDARSPLERLEDWFASRGWSPFEFQREVWGAYRSGESGLIHAATGTGKTYAAWMGPVLEALERNRTARKIRKRADAEPLRVLWITPLRALAADTEQALEDPIGALGLPWTVEELSGPVDF